jgi:hypothetical protein
MNTEHKAYRVGTFKRRAITFCSSVLAAVLSLNAHAEAALDTPKPNERLNNTGYVLVKGYGYQGVNMLFCEPKVGHIESPNVDFVSALEVKEGKCVVGGSREHRALSAQQYLDVLFGADLVEPVGIAPMTTTYGAVISVIYYRAIKRNTP